MKRAIGVVCGALAAVAVAASVATRPVPSSGAASPLLEGARIDFVTLEVLRRSCVDCHSERTRYRWYSYVWPISTWTARHVAEGRLHLNLSRWAQYSKWRRERALSEIANQVRDGDMPLREYTWLHPDARLPAAGERAIFDWTQRERLRMISGGGP